MFLPAGVPPPVTGCVVQQCGDLLPGAWPLRWHWHDGTAAGSTCPSLLAVVAPPIWASDQAKAEMDPFTPRPPAIAAAGSSELDRHHLSLDEPAADQLAHVHAQASGRGAAGPNGVPRVRGSALRAALLCSKPAVTQQLQQPPASPPQQQQQQQDVLCYVCTYLMNATHKLHHDRSAPNPPPLCRSYATVLNNTNISDEEREALIRGAPVDERNRSTADIYCALVGRGRTCGVVCEHARSCPPMPPRLHAAMTCRNAPETWQPACRRSLPAADTVAEVPGSPGTWMFVYHMYYR